MVEAHKTLFYSDQEGRRLSHTRTVGVKAPGRAKSPTRLPLKRSSLPTSFQSNGLASLLSGTRTRHLKVTDGTDAPSPAIEEDSVFAFLVGGAEEEELVSAIGGKAEMWSNSFVIQKLKI